MIQVVESSLWLKQINFQRGGNSRAKIVSLKKPNSFECIIRNANPSVCLVPQGEPEKKQIMVIIKCGSSKITSCLLRRIGIEREI